VRSRLCGVHDRDSPPVHPPEDSECQMAWGV
jgi:hypothetical protein